MPRLLVAAIVLVLLSIGFAHAKGEAAAHVYEYGIYKAPLGFEYGVSRHGIVQSHVDDIDLVEKTSTVIAQMGGGFGIRYRLTGLPRGTVGLLTIVIKYPAPGILADGGSVPFTEDEYTELVALSGNRFYTWSFDRRTDLVPGIWTFEVWVGGKKLCEQKFNVILPPIASRTSPALLGSAKVG